MLLLTDLDKVFNIIQSFMLYSSKIYLANIYSEQHTRGQMSLQEESTPAAVQARERQAGALGGSWAWINPVFWQQGQPAGSWVVQTEGTTSRARWNLLDPIQIARSCSAPFWCSSRKTSTNWSEFIGEIWSWLGSGTFARSEKADHAWVVKSMMRQSHLRLYSHYSVLLVWPMYKPDLPVVTPFWTSDDRRFLVQTSAVVFTRSAG